MRINARHSIAALATLTLLAACGSEPEAPPEPVPTEDIAPVEAPPAPPAPPPPVVENLADAAPVEQVSPDAQVLEDADASGMTARVDRDGAQNLDDVTE